MKIVKNLVVSFFVFISISCVANEIPKNKKALIEKEVTGLVGVISHGEGKFFPSEMQIELLEIKRWKYALVFFRFNFGAVDYDAQFLSLFEYSEFSPKKYALTAFRQVNVAGRRIDTFKYLGGLKLELTGTHYQSHDSNCCPSEKVTAIYSIEREDFKEQSVKILKNE